MLSIRGCRSVLLASIVLGSSMLLISGCSSDSQQAVKRSEKTVDSIGDFRKRIVDANTQLAKTMTSLDNVMTGTGDRKTAFSTYSKDVANLKKNGDDARDRAESLQARADEYIAKWEQDVSTVSSPELKAQAEARRAQVKERIAVVQSNARAAGDSYRPLLQELTDIQTVLANDLTPANIEGVKPVATRARENGAALKASLDTFIAEIDRVMGGIGPKATG